MDFLYKVVKWKDKKPALEVRPAYRWGLASSASAGPDRLCD